MKRIKTYQVDAFTTYAFGGNPAGVVTEATELTDKEMQRIAGEMNCSETAFVLPADNPEADFKVRFFTPSEEVDLCGHATVATFYVLAKEGKIELKNHETVVKQETKAGVLPVKIVCDNNGEVERVVMGQTLPQILETNNETKIVAELMGLTESDLQLEGLPMQVVSTGLPDLIVPVKNLATLKKATPNFNLMAEYQRSKGFISIHAFTFETENENSTVHVRDFAPSVNINEEAATGTANGALGAYLVMNKALPLKNDKIVIKVEQGYIMDRPSEIVAEISHNNGIVSDVKVGGSAVIVIEGMLFF